MTYQHQEFQTRLRDAERLRLYAQSIVSDHKVLSAFLAETESNSRCWENEARGSVERMARVKAKKDAARHDALMARMDSDVAGKARARVESELARVQNALVATDKVRQKADNEVSCLTDKRISLLLELGTCKDETSSIQAEALRENEALKEAYEGGLDVIFNYGYGYCAFAHNICGSYPEVPYGMLDTSKLLSPEFFINPRCPPGVVATEAVPTDVHSDEVTNALEREALIAVLEMGNSKAGEPLFAIEDGSGKEPTLSD